MKWTLFGVSAALALSAAAIAQPSATDLGTLSANTPATTSFTISPGLVEWYRFTTPGGTVNPGSWLDMVTNGPVNIDTMIGLYDDAGNRIASDDDGGPPAGIGFSLLTFGDTDVNAPGRIAAPAGSTAGFNGRHGSTLAAGQYWLAVTGFGGTTFGATGWTVTTGHVQSGQVDVWVNYGNVTGPTPPTGIGAANPNIIAIGGSTLLTVTTIAGMNPPSTGIAVTGDLSSIGGSSSQTFYDDGSNGDASSGDGVFSYQFNGNGNEFPGAYALPFGVSDAEGRSSGNSIALTITPPPPTNDACGSATAVGEGTFDWNLSGATNDGAATCGASGTNPDVWFAYTPSGDGNVEVSTCGLTTFDSVLAVFDACGGTQLVCLDDSCGLQTSITFAATSGSTYLIRLAQFGGGRDGFGQVMITLCASTYATPGSGTTEPEPCGNNPDNINGGCNSEPDIFGSIGCGETIIGTSFGTGALRDTDWFEFTLAADDTVTLTGQAQFAAQMFILNNDCVAPGILATGLNSACVSDLTCSIFLTAGTYRAFISPQTFALNDCGNGDDEYWMTLTFGAGCGGASCDPDVNCDGSPDQGDVACMILAVAGDTSCICQDPDFNQDGSADQGDVAAIIGVVAGQPCP